ncbi:MAG: hypothetical protein ACQETE_12255 [Bacteroidota bacterium]
MKLKILKAITQVLLITLIGLSGITKPTLAQRIELNKNNIPIAVVNAIQEDFPNWDIDRTKWFTFDKNSNQWLPIDPKSSTYVVQVNGKNYTAKAVYNGEGRLLQSKSILKKGALPESIVEKLETREHYKGWKLTGNQEIIRNFNNDRKAYRLTLKKEGKKKVVFFDPKGNKIKRVRNYINS